MKQKLCQLSSHPQRTRIIISQKQLRLMQWSLYLKSGENRSGKLSRWPTDVTPKTRQNNVYRHTQTGIPICYSTTIRRSALKRLNQRCKMCYLFVFSIKQHVKNGPDPNPPPSFIKSINVSHQRNSYQTLQIQQTRYENYFVFYCNCFVFFCTPIFLVESYLLFKAIQDVLFLLLPYPVCQYEKHVRKK